MSELLTRVSSRELTEWLLYYRVEPFGTRASYLGTAIVAKTVADVNRPKGKPPYKVDQFMPEFEEHEQEVDDMLRFAEMLTIAMGGEDKRWQEQPY